MSKASTVLEVPGDVFYQQLIGMYPMLGTEFSFNNPRLPGATPPGTAI